MSEAAEMIREFHALLPGKGDSRQLRAKLTQEEHDELIEALQSEDRLQIARELADVMYIAYGTAHVYGIDLDEAFRIVHEANMTKFSNATFRDDGKIIKHAEFVAPDLSGALR